ESVRVDEAVEVRRVGAADNVGNALVLQVDHEHVIELAHRRHRGRGWRRSGQCSADSERKVVGVGVVVVAGCRVAVLQGYDHTGAARSLRNRPRGFALEQLRLKKPAVKQSDGFELAAAQPQLVGVKEVDGDRGRGGVQYEAAGGATQRVRHCAGVDVGRRLAEVDDLSECG